MVKKVAALAFRKSIRKTEKTQENMAPALQSSSSVSFAFSVPTAGAVGAGERKLRMNPEVSGIVAPPEFQSDPDPRPKRHFCLPMAHSTLCMNEDLQT